MGGLRGFWTCTHFLVKRQMHASYFLFCLLTIYPIMLGCNGNTTFDVYSLIETGRVLSGPETRCDDILQEIADFLILYAPNKNKIASSHLGKAHIRDAEILEQAIVFLQMPKCDPLHLLRPFVTFHYHWMLICMHMPTR